MFDAIKFLDDFAIPYREKGARTSAGWVQVRECPLCHTSDYYMGISLKRPLYHCWYCDKSGPIAALIYKLLGITYTQAKQVVKEYGANDFIYDAEEVVHAERVSISGMIGLQRPHIAYLESRNFDPQFLERHYQIGACFTVGRFPYSIVIPVYDDEALVSATSRDITGIRAERYLSLKAEESVVDIKHCVYNIDAAQENILIVEGPFDVWRIGGSTVSLLGTAFTIHQITRILAKFPKNIFIMFDNEPQAQYNAQKLARHFSPFVNHVEIVNNNIGISDPAKLSPSDALSIRNELGL